MASVFESGSRVFLVCGKLDDMFMTGDLQANNFRRFLNSHLKGLGYKRVVFYSGARNVGKYVLDDESALFAMAANKKMLVKAEAQADQKAPDENNNNNQAAEPARAKIKRIFRPRARAAVSAGEAAPPQPDGAATNAAKEAGGASLSAPSAESPAAKLDEEKRGKLVRSQPRITASEFLNEAKAMMSAADCKSAIVFPFLEDFITDKSGAFSQYLELISYIWDEFGSSGEGNICVLLAPLLSGADLYDRFNRMDGGDILRNKFFSGGSLKRSSAIEIGLPGEDEILRLLNYARIVGVEAGGRDARISCAMSERLRIARLLSFLSASAETGEGGAGSLRGIYGRLSCLASRSPRSANNKTDKIQFGAEDILRLYDDCGEEPDPLRKLRETRGWESVYIRVSAILRDCERKRARFQSAGMDRAPAAKPDYRSASRVSVDEESAFKYKIPHFVLKGNPGVGKTTIARLLGRILFDAGILKRGHTVEAAAHDLVSPFVRDTGIKTEAVVSRAAGGALFLDDAYSLFEKSDSHNHSKEAIDTLVQILTRRSVGFCLIMAGYPEPMDRMLDMNPGLKGRFSAANIITIDDYEPDILRDIFIGHCRENGYISGEDSEKNEEELIDLDLFFKNLHASRDKRTFGNARDAISLAETAAARAAARGSLYINKEDFGEAGKYFERRGASSVGEVYAELDNYVGLEFVKELFENLRLDMLHESDARERGLEAEPHPEHFVFAGNPGTGKTTVGRLMGKFFHAMGALGGDETLFADASELVGSHYGDAKTRVTDKIDEAVRHSQVLYIDEAYQLIDSGYASETIGAMMTAMSERARDFRVIFGMYANRAGDFIKVNAGLARRVRVVDFPDYTPDQLMEIFTRGAANEKCLVSEEAADLARLILGRMYETRGENFGNAGEVKRLLVEMRRRRLRRTEALPASDGSKYEYITDDIPAEYRARVSDITAPRPIEDLMAELGEMPGLRAVKNLAKEKLGELEYARRFGGESVKPGYYFFVGGAGTGKTTAAKLFAKFLASLGIVKTDKFKYATAKDFTGRYVGETDKKTHELLKSSLDGTLFIDEAYSLSYADDAGGGHFKREALEEIISFIEDDGVRSRLCVIFAGYPKEMEAFYRSNSGLRSRGEEVFFDNYTHLETYEIFELFCRRKGYSLPETAPDVYLPMMETMSRSKYFANGRTARTIFEQTERNMKNRLIRTDAAPEDAKRITNDDLLNRDEMSGIVSGKNKQ
ncbi:hypothetical protein FACS1894167_00960 [Synergistales bacterium]|nr:hypothetical protein FACS1894167_00960 [Synergistales bacterium]